ncbi:MAG TPA: hypothetical protein PLX89_22160 [Verrucomicrobiota bacterium]|nr:hypothetical protein [Verrucomicrobiales bacterium]HRI15710.1 hypothetical protein [Verrucomicrobiota bacterium]
MNTAATSMDRRKFLVSSTVVGAGLLARVPQVLADVDLSVRPEYRGPNVILIRWGGGARRRESLDPKHTCAPFLTHELTQRGVLFPQMEIDRFHDYQTSHGEGTLYILTGQYERFRDVAESRPSVGHKFLGARFEARVPTLFEYCREAFKVPAHQALLVNGEDRGDEEFYNFSNHHLFGVNYRSQTLSLRRYKTWLLQQQLAAGKFDGRALAEKQKQLHEFQSLDYRVDKETGQGKPIEQFWASWREYYGESGLVNPRGDRLLTELTLRAIRELRPRLTMVNYQDCDYVHWGYLDHYTRGLAIMDAEVKRLVSVVEADPEYRDNTVWVVVPDCGRDDNPFAAVPCQHHFGTRSAHEIFALVFGKGIPVRQVVDRTVSQIQLAATIGRIMGMKTPFAENAVLEEVFA